MTTLDVNIIISLYRRLLLREPDTEGLKSLSETFQSIDSFDNLITTFLESQEFSSKIHSFTRKYGGNNLRFTNDHSQYGEFMKILQIFMNMGAKHKIVVDVGANGKERSNSYDLLRHFGWFGVLIEANPALYQSIDNDFSGLNYRLIKTAVSDISGQGRLALGVNSDISSLSASNTANWGLVLDEIDVQVRRLHEILDELNIPYNFDLLSLDIEGFDVRVLNDLICNSNYRPEVIIIEATSEDGDLGATGLLPLVCDIYKLVSSTTANLILSRRLG